MTTAREMKDLHERSEFGRVLKALMDERGLRAFQLARKAFGLTEDGKVKNTGKIGKYISGRTRPEVETVLALAKGLEVDPTALLAAHAKFPDARKNPRTRSAQKALPALGRRDKLPVPEPEHEAEPMPDLPQFSLVIDHAGRATLLLNLVDVPMRTAMRAMAALTAAGILPAEGGE